MNKYITVVVAIFATGLLSNKKRQGFGSTAFKFIHFFHSLLTADLKPYFARYCLPYNLPARASPAPRSRCFAVFFADYLNSVF